MSTPGGTAPRRVLLIDDDRRLLASVTDGLELVGGYEVIQASDGASGLERFFTVRPDCVVVDVRMPGLNGYQFVRALRGDPATAQVPVIVLSALVQDHEQFAGLLAGADVYLTKPVRISDLVAAVDRAISVSAAERRERARRMAQPLPEEGEA